MIYKCFGYSMYLPEIFAISEILLDGNRPFFKIIFKSDFGAGSELVVDVKGMHPVSAKFFRLRIEHPTEDIQNKVDEYLAPKEEEFSKSNKEYLNLVSAWEKAKLAP